MNMSTQQPSTVSQPPLLGSEFDDSCSSDEWPIGEAEDGRDFDDALWDALEIDDDDPQPEYGDFWYEREPIE